MNLNGEGEGIAMCGYISQPEGENSCGAYSLAYYLWETEKNSQKNDKEWVEEVYEQIKFEKTATAKAAAAGINLEYSNPDAMVTYLNNNYPLTAKMYMKGPALKKLATLLDIQDRITEEDVLEVLKKEDTSNYAIIICSINEADLALHYMLVKKEGRDDFKLLDSANPVGDSDIVQWETFPIVGIDQIIIRQYKYIGAGILIG